MERFVDFRCWKSCRGIKIIKNYKRICGGQRGTEENN